METSENVPVEVETHQLRDGKRDRGLEIVAFDKAPAAFLTVSLRVKGETSCLDSREITRNGTGVAVFFSGKLSHSGALFPGLDGPKDPPLPG